MSKKLTKREEARLLELAMKAGVSPAIIKGIKGNAEPEDRTLGKFKDSASNSIEMSLFVDKDGREYISQVKILKTGIKTKGFAIPKADFKKYVAMLNSIADKMQEG